MVGPARSRRVPLAVTPLLLLGLGLAGCSSEADGDAGPASSSSAAGATSPGTPDPATAEDDPDPATTPALELTTGGTSRFCRAERLSPYNLFDITVRAEADLEVDSVRMIGERVRAVAPALTVPGVDFGAEVSYGGSSVGRPGEGLRRARGLDWASRDRLRQHTYREGETALLVLRVAASPRPGRPATLDEVEVTYTVLDTGEQQTRTVVQDSTFLHTGDC